MGIKGVPHRKWTKKSHYVKLHLDEHIPIIQIEKEYGIKNSLVSEWCRGRMLCSSIHAVLLLPWAAKAQSGISPN